MAPSEGSADTKLRDRAYFIWERAGRPEGQAGQHWDAARAEAEAAQGQAAGRPLSDEEKVLAGRMDANIPAMLTKDVMGG